MTSVWSKEGAALKSTSSYTSFKHDGEIQNGEISTELTTIMSYDDETSPERTTHEYEATTTARLIHNEISTEFPEDGEIFITSNIAISKSDENTPTDDSSISTSIAISSYYFSAAPRSTTLLDTNEDISRPGLLHITSVALLIVSLISISTTISLVVIIVKHRKKRNARRKWMKDIEESATNSPLSCEGLELETIDTSRVETEL